MDQDQIEKMRQERKERLDRKFKEDPEVQRRMRTPRDQRSREAIEKMAADSVRLKRESGQEANFEREYSQMEKVAYRNEHRVK